MTVWKRYVLFTSSLAVSVTVTVLLVSLAAKVSSPLTAVKCLPANAVRLTVWYFTVSAVPLSLRVMVNTLSAFVTVQVLVAHADCPVASAAIVSTTVRTR